MPSSRFLSAQEAAAELSITPATLYAYVSRGLIRSEEADGGSRRRRYLREDVEKLRTRQEQRRSPAKVLEQALHWGAPVLDSAITLVTDGRLYYRGQDVVQLAAEQSIETVGAMLWDRPAPELALLWQRTDRPPPEWSAAASVVASLAPFERLTVLLPLAAAYDLRAYDLRSTTIVQTGVRIVKLMTSVVAVQPWQDNMASTLSAGWCSGHPAARRLLNAALILVADHELNVSTFTARCIASAGSTLYAAVQGGLAALQGIKHGGHTARVAALLREARSEGASTVLAGRIKRGESVPGFGQPLYPEGDPRGHALLALLQTHLPDSGALQQALAVVNEARTLLAEEPTIDFGLATLEAALSLPEGAALAIFAIGRAIGWIGHVLEQVAAGDLIRPRARYTGLMPASIRAVDREA